jgi:hypothetical protein
MVRCWTIQSSGGPGFGSDKEDYRRQFDALQRNLSHDFAIIQIASLHPVLGMPVITAKQTGLGTHYKPEQSVGDVFWMGTLDRPSAEIFLQVWNKRNVFQGSIVRKERASRESICYPSTKLSS